MKRVPMAGVVALLLLTAPAALAGGRGEGGGTIVSAGNRADGSRELTWATPTARASIA